MKESSNYWNYRFTTNTSKTDSNATEGASGENSTVISNQVSMNSLVLWNIRKVLEKNPEVDLQIALSATQERLEASSRDINAMISQHPEDRHLACALLAWQQLGHTSTDSLIQFVETARKELKQSEKLGKEAELMKAKSEARKKVLNYDSDSGQERSCRSFSTKYSFAGPVVTLPAETKIVMHVNNSRASAKPRQNPKEVIKKIEACCTESACAEKLAEMDKITNELRTRAERLARREAERAELLERAEVAWRDLEQGFLRRLKFAEEKEHQIAKKIEKLIEDRTGYKTVCAALVNTLKEKTEVAEKDRGDLGVIEKAVCDLACARHKLAEEAGRVDSILGDQQCKAAQCDRDLQFKEEKAYRNVMSLKNDLESARIFILEAERAMRSELSDLREQIKLVSNDLLHEDEENHRLNEELKTLEDEKFSYVEALEGCKVMCDGRMKAKSDLLKEKLETLNNLKEKVMECRCKLPVDEKVEVKRTPSLAALCCCTPEDRFLESCSCTSLRTKLLSDLLSDLFSGLQAELGESGEKMPCQLLKCLEDKHNWDRASIVKSNLRNFFSQLLLGELDIAIATSIEKYHAKWVGASCVDEACLEPNKRVTENEGWQERALERRAQQLAVKLAEELFQEREEQLTKRAKEIIQAGPPPCDCAPKPNLGNINATYQCEVQLNKPSHGFTSSDANVPAYWRRTRNDVTELRVQIEDLKKDSIKKKDLKLMEENIAKMVQRASGPDSPNINTTSSSGPKKDVITRETLNCMEKINRNKVAKTSAVSKKRQLDSESPKRISKNYAHNVGSTKNPPNKLFNRKMGQTFAVNLCLCEDTKDSVKTVATTKHIPLVQDSKLWKNDNESNVSQSNLSNPITKLPFDDSKYSKQHKCRSKCNCFHKAPSYGSIDKLLETLAKWNFNLNKSSELEVKKSANYLKLNGGSTHIKTTKTPPVTLSEQSNVLKDIRNIVDELNTKVLQIIHSSDYTNTNLTNVVGENTAGSNNTPISNKNQLKSTDTIISKKTVTNSSSRKRSDRTSFVKFESISNPGEKSSRTKKNGSIPITVSEYMGAINLEKSAENTCKCLNLNGKNYNTQNPKCSSKYGFKCIHSDTCNCKNNVPISHNHTKDSNISTIVQKKKSYENPILQDVTFRSSLTQNIDLTLNKAEKELATNANITNLFQNSQLFPSRGEYNINFLGVTIKNDLNSYDFDRELNNKKNGKPIVPQINLIDNGDILSNHKHSCQGMPCPCSNQLDDLKLFFTNALSKYEKEIVKIEDKALDTQSFKKGSAISNQEFCACCEVKKLDESKELEVNTFELLREHLKGKLEELKSSPLDFTDLTPEEEEDLFSTVLQKVKNVISESTKRMSCKCTNSSQVEISWSRAYSLLQEYLRTKISRVRCSCISNSETDNVLPDIINKVCQLIESDFEQVKKMCICKNHSYDNNQFEIPEKDNTNFRTKTSLCEDNNAKDVKSKMSVTTSYSNKINQPAILVADKFVIATQQSNSISSQSEQIRHINEKNHVKESRKTNVINECFLDLHDDETENFLLNNTVIKTNSQTYIKSNTEENSVPVIKQDVIKSPYVGYTVNCSCEETLASCICTKSIIQENNEVINTIWNQNLTNPIKPENTSYIMKKVSYRCASHAEKPACGKKINIIMSDPDNTQSQYLCDFSINTDIYDDGVILQDKYKNIALEKNNRTTNTLDSVTNDKVDITMQNTGKIPRLIVIENKDAFYFPLHSLGNETYHNPTKLDYSDNVSQNCDCNMVPICHVKMLVDNIENKLVNLKCTCDSLSSKVCPVHSQEN